MSYPNGQGGGNPEPGCRSKFTINTSIFFLGILTCVQPPLSPQKPQPLDDDEQSNIIVWGYF